MDERFYTYTFLGKDTENPSNVFLNIFFTGGKINKAIDFIAEGFLYKNEFDILEYVAGEGF